MKQRIFIAVFVIVCLALVAVSIDSVNCHRANVMLRHTVLSQANEILKLGNIDLKNQNQISVSLGIRF